MPRISYPPINRKFPACSWIHPSMKKYINDIETGKIPPPYRCEFRDASGAVVTTSPIPCTPTGKPKMLFN